jgi:hypothetical protein
MLSELKHCFDCDNMWEFFCLNLDHDKNCKYICLALSHPRVKQRIILLLLHLLLLLSSFTSASHIWVLGPHMTAVSPIKTFTGPPSTSSRAERGREAWTISISGLHFCLYLDCILIFCIVMFNIVKHHSGGCNLCSALRVWPPHCAACGQVHSCRRCSLLWSVICWIPMFQVACNLFLCHLFWTVQWVGCNLFF